MSGATRHGPVDLSPASIQAAARQIDPVFLYTPQFVDEGVSAELGCEVVVKVETLNPIGSFKGRGTSLLARKLDPAMAEGAGTIAVELGSLAEIEAAVVQVGDGALIAGIACWLKASHRKPGLSASARAALRRWCEASLPDGPSPSRAQGQLPQRSP